jgi:hypothetical protein
MPQLIKGQSFADGDLVTGLTLNNIIDLATLSQTAITSQTAVTTFDIQSSDYFLIYDSSANALRKASVDDIFRSGQTVKFSGISGISGADLAVAIASGQSFVINGNTSIPANLTVTGLVQGATGKFTTELTIPSGTTATRPASPVAGSVRLNTDTGFTEVWNGTAWTNSSILGSSNTFTAKNTFSNVVDVTGAFKLNDKVGFSLYQVYEETIPYVNGPTVTLWTSSAFTKPADEMWIFEVDTVINSSNPMYVVFRDGAGVAWNQFIINGSSVISCLSRWFVNVGTALSVETMSITSTNGAFTLANPVYSTGANKFRIYKHKTASGFMLTGKTYTNNGISVTVTSTAHGLTAGQYINVWASNSLISGRWVITSAATDTFVFANTATAGSGTIAYIA